jgi:hypothetical protein
MGSASDPEDFRDQCPVYLLKGTEKGICFSPGEKSSKNSVAQSGQGLVKTKYKEIIITAG